VKHPAPYSPKILDAFVDILIKLDTPDGAKILDPFAGTGLVHTLPARAGRRWKTTGVELMPRWAEMTKNTIVGDATDLPRRWTDRFQVIAVSPCYGNRMADHHQNKDRCKACLGTGGQEHEASPGLSYWIECEKCDGSGLSHRRSYAHDYGVEDFLNDAPIEQNAGAMAWGPEYRVLHRAAWEEAYRVLEPGGYMLLNVKDFIQTKKREQHRIRVSSWHLRACQEIGFERIETQRVRLHGMRRGTNRELRVTHEMIYVLRKPEEN
jgi:tRNA G10  N-methylase Trm11